MSVSPPTPFLASSAGLGDILLRKPRHKRPQNFRKVSNGSWPHLMPGLMFSFTGGADPTSQRPSPHTVEQGGCRCGYWLGAQGVCPLWPMD